MEKVLKYKNIVRQIVQEVYHMIPTDEDFDTLLILDDERGQYLLFSDGWLNNRRQYGPFLHVEVKKTGRIYLRHDGTNLEIANQLLEKGITKEEIILTFQAPYRRALSGFATA